MFKEKDLDNAILKSTKFIAKEQSKDGSFNSYSYTNQPDANLEIFSTTFYTSLILYEISKINRPKFSTVKKRACDFLLSEKKECGTYNYWAKSFEKYKSESCPDDLDDTSCALSALISYDPKLIDEKDLAQVTQILINSEANTGGPYYTWIVPKKADKKWKDVDLAVNANIGFFLSRIGIDLPSIKILIEKAITTKNFNSTYYPDYSTLYFISKFYKGKLKNQLVKILLKENSKDFKNPLECALLGVSLLNLGEEPCLTKKNVEYLLLNQKENGSFGAGTFINERTFINNNKRFSGSEAFTAALVGKLLMAHKSQSEKKEKNNNLPLKIEVVNYTREIIRNRFNSDLFEDFDALLGKIARYDQDEQIVLHPFLFAKSFKKSFPIKTDKKFLLNLAAASILGWIAYTIFDNISDENKDLDKLSMAIICNRELENLFCKDNPNFKVIFHKFMDRVDYANFYEYKYARVNKKNIAPVGKIYPNIMFIAEKSIAHCLAPLAIISKLGYASDSLEFIKLVSFYQNYLVARQLNDDAHDWKDDFNREQVNYVCEILLKDFTKKFKKPFCTNEDNTKLEKLFWDKTILKICLTIKCKIKEAKNDLQSLSELLDQNYLSGKLEELENSADMALVERKKTKEFLDALQLS